jgi:hypothetical protein
MRFRLRVALGLSALAATAILVPAAAGASTTGPKPYGVVWKPGTRLPTIPAGYKLVAWPSQSVMARLRVGQRVPMMPVTVSSRAHMAAEYSSLENSAGIVNLLAEPLIQTCGTPFFYADLGSQSTNIEQSYVLPATDVNQNFTYGSGQSSTLGMGLSTSSPNYGFSADGTYSVSTTSSWSYPDQGQGNVHWESYFEVGEYEQICTSNSGQTYQYLTHPYQWNGGQKIVFVASPPGTPYCVQAIGGKDSGFHLYKTTASTFSVGFNVSAIGFSGTAQTGYTTSAEINYGFPVVGWTGQVCGKDNYPSASNPGPGVTLVPNV